MISYYEKEEQEDRNRQQLYRRVFNTPDGKKVLTMILTDLGFHSMSNPGNPYQEVLRNFAVHLLEEIGTFHQDNLEDITRALLSVKSYVPPSEGQNEGD